ncbi:MAG: rRNA adenine dimethylase [Desulfobacterales bacterium RIFOXYA12_FULL_46_15]|nr:MAG: rRNA adenine dimethylase [Desulfobacula sp. GWF2_41_7]OGR25241.1 MAG: rRNA adenine dimethylase [Desulfobacterales bacterium RIFOXYA12_FULL_46_15]
MEKTLKKFAGKFISASLGARSGPSRPLIGCLDDKITWNRKADETKFLEEVFHGLFINSISFLRPVEPYKSLMAFLARKALESNGSISPKDCETRTFLHDLPVIDDFNPDKIIQILKKRKTVIVASEKERSKGIGPAVIAQGTVSPEQGFVTISSVCFACFVKFFTDYLDALQKGIATDRDHAVLDGVTPYLKPVPEKKPSLMKGPFQNEGSVYSAVIEAGFKTVEYGLVDSYFGNVSYLWNKTLYISQTGSSLDELSGCIDPVPLDGSTSAGITASSELSAHMETIFKTGCRAILHGHPKFSVILSMDCDPIEKSNCSFQDQCHIKCPKKRFVAGIPIVPGEVGTGPFGLCNTLPQALEKNDGAIVYGHGLFTIGKNDFSEAFANLLKVEQACQHHYLEKIGRLRKGL